MKKTRKLTTTLLALLFTLSLFAACSPKKEIVATPPSVAEGVEDNLPEIETPPVEEPTPEIETPPVVAPVKKYARYIRCEGNGVNFRSGAGTSYTVLGNAQKGTSYTVLEEKNGWYKTYYRNQTAYIHASYASVFSIEKSEDKVEEVIAEGYKLLGVPYVYGAVRLHDGKGNLLKGFSAQKFDCSSLVQYMYYKGANVLLNATTRTQAKQGKFVPKSQLQRGDCIYFTNEERQYKTGVERIGHVAVYLGDNYILHTSSDYARIEKISAKRWSFYVEARRFI